MANINQTPRSKEKVQPAAGSTLAPSMFGAGKHVFGAKVIDADSAETEDSAVHKVKTSTLVAINPSILASNVDDLIDLDELDENIILHTIGKRFAQDVIYTAVSSINPQHTVHPRCLHNLLPPKLTAHMPCPHQPTW